MDTLHNFLKWISYNRGLVFAVLLIAATGFWLTGCPPTTQSLTDPTAKVTPVELGREVIVLQGTFDEQAISLREATAKHNVRVKALNERVAAAEADIEQQQELRAFLVNTAGGIGEALVGGTATPGNIISTLLTVGSVLALGGVGYDNRRKNKVIKSLKNGDPQTK